MDVEMLGAATQARGRAIAARTTESPLVFGELVDIDCDDSAAVVALPPRVDEARVGCRRSSC
jgi:hypothetical protein